VSVTSFSPEQQAAIDARGASLLLSANAGSGKTGVMVECIVRSVLDDELPLSRVLAITFTEKAAAELRSRVHDRLLALDQPDLALDVDGAWISTIHGCCARLLRMHALSAGIDPAFAVLDARAAERLEDLAIERALADLVVEYREPAVELVAAYRVRELRALIPALHDQLRARGEREPSLAPAPPGASPGATGAELARACAAAAAELGELASPGATVLRALTALEACAAEILERLGEAKRPVLMVGVEVRRFGLESRVAALAARLGLPVVTSMMGRGLLSGTDTPPLGTYLGVAGSPEITDRVERSDALFLLGVIISDTNFGVSARQIDLRRTIRALDGAVTLGYHTYADIPLAALTDALLLRVEPRPAPPAAPGRVYPRHLPADDAPIVPDDIACAVNDLMAERGRVPIATDVGDCLFTAMDIEHTALIAPGYYASMGFGVPAGLGLQAATGERPLILVGDGAFQMTGWELGNCRRYGWDPIVIVLNNASWEMLRTFQPESRFNDLDEWDFAAAARALGGDGVRVRTRGELVAALAHAAATRGRFQLIEAMIARGALSATLSRFVAGLKRVRAETAG